jgi:Flp pilus assembly protein CpaB
MAQRRRFLIAALLVVAAIIATFWVWQRRQPTPSVSEQIVPKMKVFVATRDLPKGTKVTSTDLAPQEIPVTEAPKDAVTDPAQAANAILLQDVRQGQPLRLTMLLPSPEQRREFRIPMGLRGFVLYQPFTEGAADLLLPGDLVDVIATKRVGEVSVAEVIVQRAQVLVAENYTPGMSREERLRQAAFAPVEQSPMAAAAEARPAEGQPQPATRQPQQNWSTSCRHDASHRLGSDTSGSLALSTSRRGRACFDGDAQRTGLFAPASLAVAPNACRVPAAIPPCLLPALQPSSPTLPSVTPRPVRTVTIYRGTQREEVAVSP